MAMYALYESSSGYALFDVHGIHEIGQNVEAVESSVSDFTRFGRVVKLTAFHPPQNAEDALNQIKAVSEEKLEAEIGPDGLVKERNLMDERCSSLLRSERVSESRFNLSHGMADPVSYGSIERDIKQALISLKKGAQVLKYGRKGKPKFCPFRLSNMDTLSLNNDDGYASDNGDSEQEMDENNPVVDESLMSTAEVKGDREAEKIKKKRTIRTSQAILISLDCVLVYEP
uniref:Nucleolar protein 58/56 N-terminal domain-containing protein n=1 Tax=Brassica oleracea var. oleracea TaxID=109376 RepID=A0A0D3AWJ5_BRAOL